MTWGETLGLPLLVVEPDGRGDVAGRRRLWHHARARAGRAGAASRFTGRRSRFARRRKIGSFTQVERLEGREIIARD